MPDQAYVDHVRSFTPEEALFLHVGSDYGATVELKDGTLIWSTAAGRQRSRDGGRTWAEPESMKWEDGNPVDVIFRHFVRLKSGGIGGFYRVVGRERYLKRDWFTRSEDEGATWSRPTRVGEPFNNSVLHGGVTVTSTGRIIAPVYTLVGSTMREKGRALFGDDLALIGHHGYENFFTYCWVYTSDDEGATWRPNRKKGVWGGGGELFVTLDESAGGHYRANEPVAVEVCPEHLLMILRTPLGRLYQSWSDDNGETWSLPEPTSLASSLAPAAIGRMPGSDDLLIIWNQSSPDETQRGLQRHRLSSAVSTDGGATWSHGRNVFSIFQQDGDRTYVEPPLAGTYRAALNASRLPINDMEATYPFLDFWKETAIVRYRTASRALYVVDEQGRPRYESTPAETERYKADICLGLPLSWFHADLRKF